MDEVLPLGIPYAMTQERITRYEAFANPGVWIENAAGMCSCGNDWRRNDCNHPSELAVFYAPVTNRCYSHLVEGIYVEIVNYQSRGIPMLDGHASRPDAGRKQFNRVRQYYNYEVAREAAFAFIAEAREFCGVPACARCQGVGSEVTHDGQIRYRIPCPACEGLGYAGFLR